MLAYLDGEADPDVIDHLARCPRCRSRAAALDAEERPLRALLFRIECPSPDAWRDFYFGLLPDDLNAPMAAHLQQCPYCARELLILQSFVPLSESNFPPNPPQSPGGLHWCVAQLMPGSLANGQRGCAARKHAWTYLAGKMRLMIDSDVFPGQPDRHLINGRVWVDQAPQWTAYLWRKSRLVATAQVDNLGAFQFAALPADRYELTLSGPQARVYLPKLIVR